MPISLIQPIFVGWGKWKLKNYKGSNDQLELLIQKKSAVAIKTMSLNKLGISW